MQVLQLFVLITAVVYSCSFTHIVTLKSRIDLSNSENVAKFRIASIETLTSIETHPPSLVSDEGANRDNAFRVVAAYASECLLKSDMCRDAVGGSKGTQTSSAINWINDESTLVLKKCIEKIALKFAVERTGIDRGESSSWIRWMKTTPMSLSLNLSPELRQLGNKTVSDHDLNVIGSSREEFLNRMGCQIILLPSGSSFNNSLSQPSGSIIFGKLLYGSATQYRHLPSNDSRRPTRRKEDQTDTETSIENKIRVWTIHGNCDRSYDAADMGPAAILEISLLPRKQGLHSAVLSSHMFLNRIGWDPQRIFHFIEETDNDTILKKSGTEDSKMSIGIMPSALSGRSRNEAFKTDFKSSVGGLQPQIDAIVRRVLDGRVIKPADVIDNAISGQIDEETNSLAMASADAEELALLGLTPVRGLLLYGPPGCGKTALAREISGALRARQPKIVSAPELLDRWVGGSERLIRQLFADAESELAACNGDAGKSALHVVVIDEIDAVFRKRSGGEDSGEVTRASAVNQILSKLDGVNAIPNILLIGITNRPELLDEALLRPGRLEVQIEIPLPNREGRREILRIHFEALRRRERLSFSLCCAIDGVVCNEDGVANKEEVIQNYFGTESPVIVQKKKNISTTIKRVTKRLIPISKRSTYDLAGAPTDGFSGADIAGLVRCAGSIALSRARRDGNGIEDLLLTLEDVKQSLREIEEK